jgi:Ion channel
MASRFDTSRRHRYGLLLGLVLLTFVLIEALPGTDLARLVTSAVQGLTLLVALRTSDTRPGLVRAAAVLVAVSLVVAVAAAVVGGDVPTGIVNIISGVLAAAAPVAVAKGLIVHLREEQGVTLNIIAGVISIYLLIGYVFAFAYGALAAIANEPAFNGVTGQGNAQEFLYFSLVTLTTTGYGDITAINDVARAFAVLEALTGQLYLVTAVAISVANLRPRGRRD